MTSLPRGARTHVVKAGETLSGIAHHFGVSWHELAKANRLSNPSRLHVGAHLHIPAADHAHPRPTPPTVPAPPAQPNGDPSQPRLGDLSMRFETKFHPGQEAQAAAVVSSGVHDVGGVSYGAYQLASSAAGGRQVQGFLQGDGTPWAGKFTGQDPTTRDGPFGVTWKAVAAGDAMTFFLAQHAYIERTHYTPVVNHVNAALGVAIANRSRAVQNVVWSMSVQHGKAASLVEDALNAIGPPPLGAGREYDRRLINKLYDVRDEYVTALGQGDLKTRYAAERRDALQELEKQ